MEIRILIFVSAVMLLTPPVLCQIFPTKTVESKPAQTKYMNPQLNQLTGGKSPGEFVKSMIMKDMPSVTINPVKTPQIQKQLNNQLPSKYPYSNPKPTPTPKIIPKITPTKPTLTPNPPKPPKKIRPNKPSTLFLREATIKRFQY